MTSQLADKGASASLSFTPCNPSWNLSSAQFTVERAASLSTTILILRFVVLPFLSGRFCSVRNPLLFVPSITHCPAQSSLNSVSNSTRMRLLSSTSGIASFNASSNAGVSFNLSKMSSHCDEQMGRLNRMMKSSATGGETL